MAQRPELDPSPMLVVGRIHRLGQLLDAALRPTCAAAGLGQGDVDVLAPRRGAGPSFCRGLVDRGIGPGDARVRQITLTRAGTGLVDELIEVHVDTERRLLSGLHGQQAAQLAGLLAVLAEDLAATSRGRAQHSAAPAAHRPCPLPATIYEDSPVPGPATAQPDVTLPRHVRRRTTPLANDVVRRHLSPDRRRREVPRDCTVSVGSRVDVCTSALPVIRTPPGGAAKG